MIDAAKLVAAHLAAQGIQAPQASERTEERLTSEPVEYVRAPEASVAQASGSRPPATQRNSR